jgi:hypothetical protein
VPFIGAEGEQDGRTVEGNDRGRWSAMMVMEVAISGGDRSGSDGGRGKWCSGHFMSGRGRGAGRRQ